MQLLSRVQIPEHCSSIWGYTDPSGQEYAILGTAQGVRIYSLEDPTKPKELIFIPCSPSAWRELKTAGEFAYITTEAADGLLIADLRRIADTIPFLFVKDFKNFLGDSLSIISAHTIFTDEKNYIYLSGARPIGSGFIILDPRPDPFHPVILNYNDDQYVHETHAYKDTLYAAELFNGVFSIWDIRDRLNPVRINDQETAFHFTHSVWIEKNRNILYTADEIAGAEVEAWDVTDPLHIVKTDDYKVNNPLAPYVIPHNVFHLNDKLYVSYYTEGVRVLDTKDPQNLIEVAYYDTHNQNIDGFHGCWSVYPYFKSGICIASDIENGMFILKYDGNEPVYINAAIVDKKDSSPIYNATFKIEQGNRSTTDYSNINGIIKTGFPEEDTATITISKEGYYSLTQEIKLDKNNPLFLRFEMEELPKHELNIIVKNKQTGTLISDAKIVLYNTNYTLHSTSDQNGKSSLKDVYEYSWTLVAGKWSYKQFALNIAKLDSDQTITIELEDGYEDDFILDLGWTTVQTDPLVSWKIGDFSEIPFPSSNFPSKDIDGDLGNTCYYTNNYDAGSTDFNIHGEVALVSPLMNLNDYESIDLSYHAWAYGGFTSYKEILLKTKDSILLLESVPELLTGMFNPQSNIHVDLNHLNKDSVYFIFRLYNDSATAEMAIRLIGAFDDFKLTGNKIVSNKSVEKIHSNEDLILYPVPAKNKLYLHSSKQIRSELIKILNIYGQEMMVAIPDHSLKSGIDISSLNSGLYYLRIGNRCIPFVK